MTEVDYEEMCAELYAEQLAAGEERRKVNDELRRRFGHVEIAVLILTLAGFGAFACAVFFGWPWWIPVAFLWSGWSCLISVDYIKGAATRTVFV